MHMAHDCNLRCKYCFADTGEFHGARMLMPEKVAYAALIFSSRILESATTWRWTFSAANRS